MRRPPLRCRCPAAILLALATIAFSHAAPAADWLLVNGRILTLDRVSTRAEAIAIENGRVARTGPTAQLDAAARPGTRRVDLGGRTVIPGLIDSHIHAIRAGVHYATEVSWIGATTIPEALERIRRSALSSAPATWIVIAGGWTPAQFAERRRPTRQEIELAAPGRRVYIQLFYRSVFLSSQGREAMGIQSDADLPKGAKPDLDSDGTSSHWIVGDAAAITSIYERLPAPSLDKSIAGTRRFFAELNRLGVTGVIDPGGHNLAPEEYEALLHLAQNGELTVRVVYSISAPRPGSELEDLKSLTRFLPMGMGDDMLRFNGIGERVTWGMYNNDMPSEAQKDALFAVARWAADRGLTATFHWNNDRSVPHLLDVIERVDRVRPLHPLRWSIAHLHDASDASLARMKALGVGWLAQNGLYFAAASYIASKGAAIDRTPPFRTALRLGIAIGAGTDATRVMGHNPFVSLRWMTDGRTVDGLATRSSSELLSREEALRLYTQGSAWFAFADGERGSLEPGRLADLAILDRDYLTAPPDELAATRALATMIGGRIVHAEGPFADLR